MYGKTKNKTNKKEKGDFFPQAETRKPWEASLWSWSKADEPSDGLHQMLGRKKTQVNCQDQKIQSGN